MKIEDGLLFFSVCEQLPCSKAHLRCDLLRGGDNSTGVEVKRAVHLLYSTYMIQYAFMEKYKRIPSFHPTIHIHINTSALYPCHTYTVNVIASISDAVLLP